MATTTLPLTQKSPVATPPEANSEHFVKPVRMLADLVDCVFKSTPIISSDSTKRAVRFNIPHEFSFPDPADVESDAETLLTRIHNPQEPVTATDFLRRASAKCAYAKKLSDKFTLVSAREDLRWAFVKCYVLQSASSERVELLKGLEAGYDYLTNALPDYRSQAAQMQSLCETLKIEMHHTKSDRLPIVKILAIGVGSCIAAAIGAAALHRWRIVKL